MTYSCPKIHKYSKPGFSKIKHNMNYEGFAENMMGFLKLFRGPKNIYRGEPLPKPQVL